MDFRRSSMPVISGHGRFNPNFLATVGRKKIATFPIPAGSTLTVYAPDGAALDNPVANKIERGDLLTPAMLEMKQNDGAKTERLPDGYPRVLVEGELMVDYTVTPPSGLPLVGDNITVLVATALRELVNSNPGDIHYACCNAGFSDSFPGLFLWKGWHVRLKTE
jgi:hypothetical protein